MTPTLTEDVAKILNFGVSCFRTLGISTDVCFKGNADHKVGEAAGGQGAGQGAEGQGAAGQGAEGQGAAGQGAEQGADGRCGGQGA